MAFVTRAGENVTRLAVRDRGDLEARLLPGTEGGDAPFFSPDGRWLGFFAGGKLYKVAVAGGTPVLVADKAQFALPSALWLADGRIVYAGADFKMMAVDADGGNPVVLVPAPKSGGAALSGRPAGRSSADPDPVRQHLRRAGARRDRRARRRPRTPSSPAPPRPRSCRTAPSSPCAATARSWPPRSMPAGTASPARRRRSSPASRSRSGSSPSSPSPTTGPWSISPPTPLPACPPWPRWTARGTPGCSTPGGRPASSAPTCRPTDGGSP